MKFKVGDRVRVYDRSTSIDGEIIAINNDQEIFIRFYRNGNQNQQGPFNPKQCRKLVKKNPRSVWVRKRCLKRLFNNENALGGSIEYAMTWKTHKEDWVELREVKRGQK